MVTKIYRNDGGSFTDINAGLPGIAYGMAAWGDYDNDGDLDILLNGITGSAGDSMTKIYQNNAGIFVDIDAGLIGMANSSGGWGDYDNDGDLDILVAGWVRNLNNPVTAIYRNDRGTFTPISSGLVGIDSGAAAWGDYDNDGDLDILLTGWTNVTDNLAITTKIYQNNGGFFTDINADLMSVGSSAAAWGDYDNDGDLDILLTGQVNPDFTDQTMATRIYLNEGGSFTPIDVGLPGVISGATAWGDYDNDGDLDILLTGNTGLVAIALVHKNDQPIANTPPAPPTGLAAAVNGISATLSWAAASDGQTPANGLTYNLRLSRTPGGVDIQAPMADGITGYRRIPGLGNAQQGLTATLTLPPGTYYWSVQAIDIAFAGSAFAPEASFTLVSPVTPPTAVILTGPTTGRSGFTYTFTAAVTPVTATQPITYAWDTGDQAPVIYTSGLSNSVTFSWTATGTKVITVTAANAGGMVTGTTTITISDSPITGLNATNDSPTELGQTTMLTATVTAGSNVSYAWAFGDGATGSGITVTHTYPAVGVYTAVVTADNSVGVLTKTTKVTITGIPQLSISKNGPATAEIGEPILYTLTVTNSGNDTATGLVITDVIPAGATYINGGTREGDLVSWTVDSLAPDQSTQAQFTVTATGSITNSNYGVRTSGGYTVMGRNAISTQISNKAFLPIIIKN